MATTSAGQVSVRFSVENAEVVRQALQQLGRDGDRALKAFDASAQPANKSLNAISAAVSDLRGKAASLALSTGTVGTSLLTLGPAGLAAATALGGLVLVFNHLADGAGKFAQDALKLRDVAQTLNLTTSQLQAISDAGAEFALSEDRIASGLQRFVGQMDEVRRGQGALFETLQRTDAGLAREMAAARSTAEALDILGRAYAKSDAERQAALSRAAFGRGGFDIGLLVQSMGQQGGIAKLEAEFRQSGDALDDALIRRVAKLKAEIDDMAGDARRNFQSIYSAQFLETQHRSTEMWREFSRSAKEFALSPDLDKLLSAGGRLWDWFRGPDATALTKAIDLDKLNRDAATLRAGIERAQRDLADPGVAGRNAQAAIALMQRQLDAIEQRMARLKGDAPLSAAGPAYLSPKADQGLRDTLAPSNDKAAVSAEFLYNTEKKRLQLLGSAITPMEQYRLKTLEIAAAQEKDGVSTDVATRATAAALQAHSQAIVSGRERIRIATEEQLLAVRLAELQQLRAQGFIKTDGEMAQAEARVRREVQDTYEAMQVRNSALPGLKQLELNSGNLERQLDQFGTGTLSNLNNGLLQFQIGAKGFGDAARDMGLVTVRALLSIINQMLILKPLAAQMQSWFSAIPGFGGGAGGSGSLVEGLLGSARGNVFAGGQLAFAGGGLVTQPASFSLRDGRRGIAGERDWEAIAPLFRGPDGVMGVRMAGGGSHVTIGGSTIIVQGSADAKTLAIMDQKLEAHERRIAAQIVPQVRNAQSRRRGLSL